MRIFRTQRLLAVLCIAIGATAFMPSAVAEVPTESGDTEGTRARAVVRDVNNAFVGVLTILFTPDGRMVVSGRLGGLTPGFHGFHIHAVGLCDPAAVDPAGNPAPFSTAGGHLNPTGVGHGQHAGDLPVLHITRNGSTHLRTESDTATVANVFDADRSAFIIHSAADNHGNIPNRYVSTTTNQPGPDPATLATGDSGSRVACGVIRRG